MSLVTGIQPAEFIFVSSLQARHQKKRLYELYDLKNKPDKHDTEALATVLNCRAKQAAKAKTSCKRKRCSKPASVSKRRCLSSLEFSPLNLSLSHPLQARHQKNDYIIKKTNWTNMTRKHSCHGNSARWIYLCLILANSSHKDNQPMNKRTNTT